MSSNENLSPAVLKRIMKEISGLVRNPPEDIKLCPNDEDITDVQAIITGPAGTPYEGGAFRIRLKLGSDFPAVPPKGWFVTKIFHPNVSATGEICVNTLKKDWKENLGIEHILLTVKCLLIVPNAESALNEEAGRLLLEAYDDYAAHARLMTGIHAKPVAPSMEDVGIAEASMTTDASSTAGSSAVAKKVKKAKKTKKSLKRL